MEKLFAFVFYLLPLSVFAQQGLDTNSVEWKNVLAKAKSENKYVFVNIVTPWSGTSAKMDSLVFSQQEVKDTLDKYFVSFRRSGANSDSSNVEAYPTFLFYNSTGRLVFRSSGAKELYIFKNLLNFVTNPEFKETRDLYFNYLNGKKDFPKLSRLVAIAGGYLGEVRSALAIAKDYKEGYLDKLDATESMSKSNLNFINENQGLLSHNDIFFKTAYRSPGKIDSVIGISASNKWVQSVIANDYIKPWLYENGKPSTKSIDWNSIRKNIKSKYPLVKNVDDIIEGEKIPFYRNIGNWEEYTKLKSARLTKDSANRKLDPFWDLNIPAWDVFLECNHKPSLERALSWSELSLKLAKQGETIQLWDTKANLLYKLGKKEQAIEAEEAGIAMARKYGQILPNGIPDFVEEYENTIEKMKKGQPTWE
jgi:thioredoxin-related protein